MIQHIFLIINNLSNNLFSRYAYIITLSKDFMSYRKFLTNRTIQIIIVISLYAIFVDYIPIHTQQQLYTFSLLIKDILMILMPLTICIFIASTVSMFRTNAILFVTAIVIFELCSNLLSVWYAIGMGSMVSDFGYNFHTLDQTNTFDALWRFPITKPSWWSADRGALYGVVIGCIIGHLNNVFLTSKLEFCCFIMEWLLTKVFSSLIPLFVLGFAVQMYQKHLLSNILIHYSSLCILLLFFLVLYLTLIFIIGALPQKSKNSSFIHRVSSHIKNIMPAGIIAFTSGCSLSTMPWTIEGATKNLDDKSLARAIIPATTNIQQIGDNIVNIFLCFMIYRYFYGQNPTIQMLVAFSLIYVLNRFATAAVMGGAIFVMLPIYEEYLYFNEEMIAMILAFNIILDPIVTSSNVIANGGLCRIFEVFWTKLNRYRFKSI